MAGGPASTVAIAIVRMISKARVMGPDIAAQ